MSKNGIQQEILMMFILSIYLFQEFEVKENQIKIKLKSNTLAKTDEKLLRNSLSYLLSVINTITEKEFYFTFDSDLTHASLHCHSYSEIFSILDTQIG